MRKINKFPTINGYDLSKYNSIFIEKSIHNRAAALSIDSISEYLNLATSNESEANQLLDSLRISHSEFFRNTLTSAILDKLILPAIIYQKKLSKNKEIRIWSAACAGGQEAYSLAIQIEELLTQTNTDISYRIFATDIKQEVIDDAQSGIYFANMLNNVSFSRLNKWFIQTGNSYTINDILKRNIDFSVFDLLDDNYSSPPSSIFGHFDIVVCANILFYYKPECQNKIIQKTSNTLSKNGYLITGETERDILHKLHFIEAYPPSAIYQK